MRNQLKGNTIAGKNAVPYDKVDTFTVYVTVRNLSGTNLNSISITEKVSPYYQILDANGAAYSISGNSLIFNELSVNAQTEAVLSYCLASPVPESEVHENVDNFIEKENLLVASENVTKVTLGNSLAISQTARNYSDLLFSARIFADTDVNWKNFLGLEYQPFKVFMIMENKSRTQAEQTVYTQYIPKDVPFYWVDGGINIPILKTPGGKFVSVLRGSNDENNPEYDMDSDGHPDAWLDTSSIYPKGYTITEEEVYWANPWNHLRTGNQDFAFEDLDYDGTVAADTNNDGVVDITEEGDKLRVWKVTWNIGQVKGYEYYDPYCSYEIWVDPPDLVPLSAGVGHAYDSLEAYPNMFYPNTPNINAANVSDTSWTHWMKRDDNGNIVWKQLVRQSMNNYQGYAFLDTSTYTLMPYDSVMGTVPQPVEEFIAVLSLGGEEIDMTHPAPSQSLYSKVNYKTIFNQDKVTPIRTTYTYYAPLPNPLQFEYMSNIFTIYDSTGNMVQELPEHGKAHLQFDIDASTEYSYYWIRNVGHDVDYNDPSELAGEGAGLGDGVFGYFIYEIPKGMGGYSIKLPRLENGEFNTDSIVQIDGKPFAKWLDNPNTLNQVEVWETPFSYQVYIPQILIPPALDDDNFDGIDDWVDDRGDRFQSGTGYLHDAFMPGNGEDYENKPDVPFTDKEMAGYVDSGWDIGADGQPGDDWFENLGKTHITIHASYEGRGREGSVEISKGGVLVVEEIFGGSPWVIFSHVLSGFAQGVDLSVTSSVSPSVIKFGIDTVYIRHVIEDKNEPHSFDQNFDPYHVSYGFGDASIVTFVGAKDPCNLLHPAIEMPAIIDPAQESHTIELVPYADAENPDLTAYPRSVTGTFVEVRVEVNNGTDYNWENTTVTPDLSKLGSTTVEMSYVAYPRPLVPDDQPGTFTTGWRFNQPEGEVVVKMGNTLKTIQPSRKAYFVYLINIDPGLEKGIYDIPFSINGQKVSYKGTNHGSVSYDVPTARFCIAEKNADGSVKDFQQITIDNASLKKIASAIDR
ncbi:MAG: hypothetical protein HC896_08430 [Bacteroidales bacterium]|nr:hypothetical protein [Bacteroidales bacterium]